MEPRVARISAFCRKKLRMRTTAVEINPVVVHACRGWFALPQDDDRLQVVVADAADEIRRPHWAGSVDMLQVDLYDTESAAPVLDSEDFYRDCRALLTPDGSMAVNLLGRSPFSLQASLDRIAAAFGRDALWSFPLAPEGNTVVLAQRTPQAPGRDVLTARAAAIESRWGLPARRWPEEFSPMGS
jgi:spermidine synthase